MAEQDVKLDVLIATHGPQGLERVAAMAVPRVPQVRYIVSCQSAPRALPTALLRPDMEVHFTDTTGVSANRNCLLRLARAPYALMADNDLTLLAEGLPEVIAAFEKHPRLTLATFRHEGPDGKVYPAQECSLAPVPKNYYATCFEMALRMEHARQYALHFCEQISIGTPYVTAGEENVLFTAIRRRGLQARFFPVTICRHPGLTTGLRSAREPGVLRAQGMVVMLDYPLTALLRLPLKAWRTGGNVLRNLWYLCAGAVYAVHHRRMLLDI